MNLYLLEQERTVGYDHYDAAVVAAHSEDEAKRIHPSPFATDEWWNDEDGYDMGNWTVKLEQVRVTLIGTAAPGVKLGVVLASYHAG